MKKAIQKAIEGGYDIFGKLKNVGLGEGVFAYEDDNGQVIVRRKEVLIDYAEIVKYRYDSSELREDPLFWQALGKAMGWNGVKKTCIARLCPEEKEEWLHHWHRFIDHLSQGGDADSFFKNLITP